MESSQFVLRFFDFIAVFVGERTADDFNQVNQIADAEQTGGQKPENPGSDFAHIKTVCADAAEENAEKQRGGLAFFGCGVLLRRRFGDRRHIVVNRFAVQKFLNGFSYAVDVCTARHRQVKCALYTAAQRAVFVHADAVDTGFGFADAGLNFNMRAVLT